MARIAEPIIVHKRGKNFQFTLNSTCGLPQRVCAEWRRRSFTTLPDELFNYRNPQSKSEAKANAQALIAFLKKKLAEGGARRIKTEDITVGGWLEKFTVMDTSPRTGINVSRNRPYSIGTIENYRCFFDLHIKGDPFTELKMAEVEEEDVLEFTSRISVKKLADGRQMGGTRAFFGVLVFVRMAFKNYHRNNRGWINPFQCIDPPSYTSKTRDALTEDEVVKLFGPGVLKTTFDLAVCAAMFLSGLRMAEIFALRPECLDWHTPKIRVKNAWQCYSKKKKMILGPTKSKRDRDAPFDPILQEAIKKLWEINGKQEFIFCRKSGKLPSSSWISRNLRLWIGQAGIELGGRNIVPHSSRHSLASILEEKGIPLRHIQELLGHYDLKTTIGYLHTAGGTIRKIGQKITEAREHKVETEKVAEFKIS
ncbi:MAG: tyrosine-type recombinase/integrase [Spirochaetaceae bacterium]|nr:tyrosine-type recombinase/integrase [Spirochaetaceae bacterium]